MSHDRDDFCTLQARLIMKTEAAVRITNRASASEAFTEKERTLWVPRSLMGTMTTLKDGTNFPIVRFTLPQWKVDQDNLNEFVKE